MPAETRLLVVALSGRALARSAARCYRHITVIDGFGDRDTRQYARRCHRVPLIAGEFDREALRRTLDRVLTGAVRQQLIYGAGMEPLAAPLADYEQRVTLCGNTAAVLAAAKDPRRLFPLLDRLGIDHPAVSWQAPDHHGWLVKRADGCGGGQVRRWQPGTATTPRDYWQREVAGPVGSMLFVSDGRDTAVLGFNTQWQRPHDYVYAGAINRNPLPSAQRRDLSAAVRELAPALGLRGLNSLDFVLTEDGPQVLELNPRPGASLDLHDEDYPSGLVALHARGCRGGLDDLAVPVNAPQPVRAHAIVYAATDLDLAAAPAVWPRWCSDVPPSGSRIAAGDPVCTVHGSGTSVDSVTSMTHARRAQMLRWLEPCKVPASPRAVA